MRVYHGRGHCFAVRVWSPASSKSTELAQPNNNNNSNTTRSYYMRGSLCNNNIIIMCVAVLFQSRSAQTFAVYELSAFERTRLCAIIRIRFTPPARVTVIPLLLLLLFAHAREVRAPLYNNIMAADMIIYNKRRPSGRNIYNIRLVDVGFTRNCFTPTNSDAVPDLCGLHSTTRALHTRVTYGGSLRKSFEGNQKWCNIYYYIAAIRS